LGAYELLYLRTPSHAAIHEAVELAKKKVRPGAGGLTNGILRTVDRNRERLPRVSGRDQAQRLGIRHSHPDWMVQRWLDRFGEADTEALLTWNNERPLYTVRVNTLKIAPNAFKTQLTEAGIEWTEAAFLEDFIRLPKLQPLVRGRYLSEGWCAVQDESSGLIVRLLDPRPGETVIDACAAPGGKTLYCAARMKGEGVLHAIDAQPHRLEALDRVLGAYEASWVTPTVSDLRNVSLGAVGDRVLLDAPCSGLGVLAKRADLRWNRTPEEVEQIARIQRALLDAAAHLVKPGGVLVYSTCTLESEENENQIAAFLARHPEFSRQAAAGFLPREVVHSEGYLATFPPKHGLDGVFGARMIKSG
jgi:16S rRNA (cytosine967-C5)-methyltransferase